MASSQALIVVLCLCLLANASYARRGRRYPPAGYRYRAASVSYGGYGGYQRSYNPPPPYEEPVYYPPPTTTEVPTTTTTTEAPTTTTEAPTTTTTTTTTTTPYYQPVYPEPEPYKPPVRYNNAPRYVRPSYGYRRSYRG